MDFQSQVGILHLFFSYVVVITVAYNADAVTLDIFINDNYRRIVGFHVMQVNLKTSQISKNTYTFSPYLIFFLFFCEMFSLESHV